jgi:hypothetical protein
MTLKNYWPQTISLMIFGSIIASTFTIKIAINNPVEDSNLFLDNYHVTDKNINEIFSKQIDFTKNYQVKANIIEFSDNIIKIDFNIYKDGNLLTLNDEVKFDLSLTRPETRDFDQIFNSQKIDFNISKAGRWNLYLKVQIDKSIGFFNYEIDSRKKGEIKILDPFVSLQRLEKIKKIAEQTK